MTAEIRALDKIFVNRARQDKGEAVRYTRERAMRNQGGRDRDVEHRLWSRSK